jgi:hypothetical protein
MAETPSGTVREAHRARPAGRAPYLLSGSIVLSVSYNVGYIGKQIPDVLMTDIQAAFSGESYEA